MGTPSTPDPEASMESPEARAKRLIAEFADQMEICERCSEKARMAFKSPETRERYITQRDAAAKQLSHLSLRISELAWQGVVIREVATMVLEIGREIGPHFSVLPPIIDSWRRTKAALRGNKGNDGQNQATPENHRKEPKVPSDPMSLTEAAGIFKMDPRTLRKAIDNGTYAAKRVGKQRWVFERSDIEARKH